MPLESQIPKIDDRDYAAIIKEIKARVERYVPEWQPSWSDLNNSDPGVTLAQVFAWVADMLVYRLNQVPKLSYIKFLQMVGMELHPATPATVEMFFPVKSTHTEQSVIVPKGAQVIAETAGGGAPLVFEAPQALVCLRASLDAVVVYDGAAYTNVSELHADFEAFQPFGSRAPTDSALYLGFTDSAVLTTSDLTLMVWAAEDSAAPEPVSCDFSATPTFASATVVWEYWNGSDWAGLVVGKDETSAMTKTGTIILRMPGSLVVPKTDDPATGTYYWIRARLADSQFSSAPKIAGLRHNSMRLVQMETITDEVLGGSDGSSEQVFQITNIPVLDGSLVLEIDQGLGAEVWTQVQDFLSSGPESQVYVLNPTTGEVRLGDGIHGAVAIANADNPSSNVVARSYRKGGGSSGNVPAKTLKMLRSPIDGIDPNGVVNPVASYGGGDEETLEEAVARAPLAIRARCRAVTPEDFEALALEVADVKRAKANPLVHPDYPGVQVPGVTTVTVIPDGTTSNPVPSSGTLRTVCAYLSERRTLTTELYIRSPHYVKVYIEVRVEAEPTADLALLQTEIEERLNTYFHALKGGDNGQGWPFGGRIFYSKVLQKIIGVEGVDTVTSLDIFVDGTQAPACKDVSIPADAVAYSSGHTVTVGYVQGGNA